MIIVTGGAGFIGSNIIRALNNKGISDILVVDNLKNGIKFLNLIDLKIIDYIDKKDFIIKIINNEKLDSNIKAIFHEGACTSTTEWNGEYVMYNNYQYSKKLLNYCLEHMIPFFYASSAAIYGDRTSNFIELRDYEKPINLYGYSKFLFDEYVRSMLPKANSQIVGLRYFNVYGPHEEHKGKMASIVFHLNTQINNNENLKLFKGSEKFKRDFIYINDVVDVNLWFFRSGVSGIFNIGTGYAESFKTVADFLLTFYKKGNIEYISFPDNLKGHYQFFTQANLANLRAVGYNKPFKNIADGITEYMSWLKYKQIKF